MLRGVLFFILRPCPVAFVLDGIFLFLSMSGIRKMVHSRRVFSFSCNLTDETFTLRRNA